MTKVSGIKKAMNFCKKAHARQYRNDEKTPYFTHPFAVYGILRLVTDDEDVLISGLLHDVIEDTEYGFKDIKKIFGLNVANLVQEVTNDANGQPTLLTYQGAMIKCADILHNVSTSQDNPKYVQKKVRQLRRIDKKFVEMGSGDTLGELLQKAYEMRGD